MELLMRAKRFIAQKTSRLAMVAVPLAALATVAIPAQASSVVFSAGTCTTTLPAGDIGSCSSSQPNPTSVAMSGGASVASNGGTIEFVASGGTNGGTLEPGQQVPVAWDFSLSSSGGSYLVDWTVNFVVDFQAGPSLSFMTSGSALINTDVSGNNVIDVGTGGTVVGWGETLTTSSDFTYMVTGSEEMSSPIATVPEPAGVFVLPAASALLLLRRKKNT